jgi:hypothetical protein
MGPPLWRLTTIMNGKVEKILLFIGVIILIIDASARVHERTASFC